ncbi:type I-E CRISPR-associated protein Cas7/Cse4/CasC [Siccirubricoccus sp. KC 17139]|uniref:Type I-E CRISPR-associated protein Cas7/Cse4/CasC n=1 Tax=Siccirubricoccus soli TaxID=2899147 RepID=A0ABT1D428_9PROT|nr:type I-E CRISPR-associated protein Cas7/Cse4/CasC [Siccirubricoccus soli]MCO6416035.1 type I-E CRISPR-associated protein Cas7/Cse4/CasC [Siccirubricoccus soli]MCP2682167.1 type I-E CRISPR-associated protein Cas7/Cse4/CasC [Siccirubricoccus soli]
MTPPRFVQIHTLAAYPAVLLNRDDAGLAKRLPFGGASRIRVSSQCLKRHWRVVEDDWALKAIGQPMAIRSREVVEREIMPRLGELPSAIAEAVRVSLAKKLYGDKSVEISSRQALLLGQPEIEHIVALARTAVAGADSPKAAEAGIEARFGKGEGKKNLAAMKAVAGDLAAGLESALFGRMVTSDPEANTEAAIHVAHAFTVHAEESESDYFTVIDDLTREAGETGSAGLFETELTSGLFYGYVVVDVPGLVANLGNDAALGGRVVEHLLHLIATVSPGAKKGSTAPYAWAEALLVELGTRQPRSLANAFRRPVPLSGEGDLLGRALDALSAHMARLDACYGLKEERGLLSAAEASLPGTGVPRSLDDLAAWVRGAIAAGAA